MKFGETSHGSVCFAVSARGSFAVGRGFHGSGKAENEEKKEEDGEIGPGVEEAAYDRV